MTSIIRTRGLPALLTGILALGVAAPQANAAVVIDTGGALGSPLLGGPADIDGDVIPDIDFTTPGWFDRFGPWGLTGYSDETGMAWVRQTSDFVALDGIGRDFFAMPAYGAVPDSADNWSKVYFTRGSGWVQWYFDELFEITIPILFVLEDPMEDLSARQAFDIAYASPADPDPDPIPAPGSLLLMLLGSVAPGLRRRGRRHAMG